MINKLRALSVKAASVSSEDDFEIAFRSSHDFRAAASPANISKLLDLIDTCEGALKTVSAQLQFSSMARAGDPTQQDDMKMEAIWAGTLEEALQRIREMKNDH